MIPPGLRASVAVGVQPVTSRPKPMTNRPIPADSQLAALPLTGVPPEPTEARSATPDGPAGPGSPLRACRVEESRSATVTVPFRIASEVTARERSSARPTESRFSCFAPTLLRGKVMAAYDVLPIAMNTAIVAIEFEYVSFLRHIALL